MDRQTLLSYEELKQKINQIPNPQHKNFIKLTYACLGRIGEVVRNKPGCYSNPPITGQQLQDTATHLIIEVLTEKTHQLRRVPVNRELEGWLTESLIGLKKYTPGPLFDYSTRWGEKIFEKYFDTQKIHLLRKWRTTHLLQGKCTKRRLEEIHVLKMGGWQDTKSLHKHYSGVIVEDYLELI